MVKDLSSFWCKCKKWYCDKVGGSLTLKKFQIHMKFDLKVMIALTTIQRGIIEQSSNKSYPQNFKIWCSFGREINHSKDIDLKDF